MTSTDCSPPGPSVHGILQATILLWVAMPSSSRQQYWCGLPHPLPGPGIEPTSFVSPALQEDSLPAEPSEKLVLDYSNILSSTDLWVQPLPFKAAGLLANSLLWLSPFFLAPLSTTLTSVYLSLIHLPRPVLSTTFFTKHF